MTAEHADEDETAEEAGDEDAEEDAEEDSETDNKDADADAEEHAERVAEERETEEEEAEEEDEATDVNDSESGLPNNDVQRGDRKHEGSELAVSCGFSTANGSPTGSKQPIINQVHTPKQNIRK